MRSSAPAVTLRLRPIPDAPQRMPRRVRSRARRSKRQTDLEDVDGVEGKLGFEAALDVRSFAETMLLARKQEITDRIAFAPQHLDHGFRLVRRNDLVFFSLEEDHRLRQPLRMRK